MNYSPNKLLKSWFQGLIFTCLGLLILNHEGFQALIDSQPQKPMETEQALLDRSAQNTSQKQASTPEPILKDIEQAFTLPTGGTVSTDPTSLATIAPQTYFDPTISKRFRPLIAYSVGQNSAPADLVEFFAQVAQNYKQESPVSSINGFGQEDGTTLGQFYHRAALGLLLEEMAYRNETTFLPIIEEFRKVADSPMLIAQASLAIQSIQERNPTLMRDSQARWLKGLMIQSRSTAAEPKTLARVDDYQDLDDLNEETRARIRAELKIQPRTQFDKPEDKSRFDELEEKTIRAKFLLNLAEFDSLPPGIVNQNYAEYVQSRVTETQFQYIFKPDNKETKQTANLSMRHRTGDSAGQLSVYLSAGEYDLLIMAAKLIHEARHINGPDHGICPINPVGEACNGFDKSFKEQGSYAAELEFLIRVHLHGKNFSNYVQKVAGYYALDYVAKRFGTKPLSPVNGLAIALQSREVEVFTPNSTSLNTLKIPRNHFYYYNGYSLSLIPEKTAKENSFKFVDLFSKSPSLWEDSMPLRPNFFGPGTRLLHERHVARAPLEFNGKKLLDFVHYDFEGEKTYLFLTEHEVVRMVTSPGKGFQTLNIGFPNRGFEKVAKLSVHFSTTFPDPTVFLTEKDGSTIYRLKGNWKDSKNQDWAQDPSVKDWKTETFPERVQIQKPVHIGEQYFVLDREEGKILNPQDLPQIYKAAVEGAQGKIQDLMEIELWNYAQLLKILEPKSAQR